MLPVAAAAAAPLADVELGPALEPVESVVESSSHSSDSEPESCCVEVDSVLAVAAAAAALLV